MTDGRSNVESPKDISADGTHAELSPGQVAGGEVPDEAAKDFELVGNVTDTASSVLEGQSGGDAGPDKSAEVPPIKDGLVDHEANAEEVKEPKEVHNECLKVVLELEAQLGFDSAALESSEDVGVGSVGFVIASVDHASEDNAADEPSSNVAVAEDTEGIDGTVVTGAGKESRTEEGSNGTRVGAPPDGCTWDVNEGLGADADAVLWDDCFGNETVEATGSCAEVPGAEESRGADEVACAKDVEAETSKEVTIGIMVVGSPVGTT